jgi:TRAP-type C4-dicarboxylate transport system permease large subunit
MAIKDSHDMKRHFHHWRHIFTGEIVSNTATAAPLTPISASLATSLQIDPVLLMVPITIATSFGFVMPWALLQTQLFLQVDT